MGSKEKNKEKKAEQEQKVAPVPAPSKENGFTRKYIKGGKEISGISLLEDSEKK